MFIYDLNKERIRWSHTPRHRYSNFAWRADSQSAYLLETHVHESIMKILDVTEGITTRESQFPDAHVIKQSPDGRWIVAWFKKSHRFIRQNLETQAVVNIRGTNQSANANQWALSDHQFVWIDQPANGPSFLRRLKHDETESIQIGETPYYGSITISASKASVILTTTTRGSIELVEI